MTITFHDDHGYTMLHLSTNLIVDPNLDGCKRIVDCCRLCTTRNGNTAGSGSEKQCNKFSSQVLHCCKFMRGVLLSYDHLWTAIIHFPHLCWLCPGCSLYHQVKAKSCHQSIIPQVFQNESSSNKSNWLSSSVCRWGLLWPVHSFWINRSTDQLRVDFACENHLFKNPPSQW